MTTTLERPEDSVDTFSNQPVTERRERRNLASESPKPVDGLSRRFLLAGVASTAVLPMAAAATVAIAPPTLDAELIELGTRLEPLIDGYYAAREPWARSLNALHAELDQRFGRPEDWGYFPTPPDVEAASDEICERLGYHTACTTLNSAYEEMEPLLKVIGTAPVHSIEGLRAKALVAFYEIAPLCAGDTNYSFDNAYAFKQLFTAVADLCGLNAKLAATGYKLPDVVEDDINDDGEEA